MESYKDVMENPPVINIGKNLITSGILKQILDTIKKKEIIKIKLLRSAFEEEDQKNIIASILAYTGLYLLDVRGHSFVLSRKPIPDFKTTINCSEIIRLSKDEEFLSSLPKIEFNERDNEKDIKKSRGKYSKGKKDLNKSDLNPSSHNLKDNKPSAWAKTKRNKAKKKHRKRKKRV